METERGHSQGTGRTRLKSSFKVASVSLAMTPIRHSACGNEPLSVSVLASATAHQLGLPWLTSSVRQDLSPITEAFLLLGELAAVIS